MIYMDNAATSWPKPDQVYQAVDVGMRKSGNPGRSGHRLSLDAGRIVQNARNLAAQMFGVADPSRVVFTLNTTDALNLAIHGLLKRGDHVITSNMEHNSVARPLEWLKNRGFAVSKVPMDPVSGIKVEDIEAAICKDTKLVAITHVSNVTGTQNQLDQIGELCRLKGLIFLVDAAQSAGEQVIDVKQSAIDLLAFPGHKALLGPQGTGGLYIAKDVELDPVRQGGTGSHSEMLSQPEEMPDRFESGTANVPGLAGLTSGIQYIQSKGLKTIQEHHTLMANRLIEGFLALDGITIYGPPSGSNRAPVVSITVDVVSPTVVSSILDESFDIAARAGLHCAPDAHTTLGTIGGGGTIRFSPGFSTTTDDVDACIDAVQRIRRSFL